MTPKEIWDKANPSLSHENIIFELMEAPDKIAKAEHHLHYTKMDLLGAKDALRDTECRILTSLKEDGTPLIDGKNADVRASQLKILVLGYHTAVRECEANVMDAERNYSLAVNTFRALRSVAALLSGEGR